MCASGSSLIKPVQADEPPCGINTHVALPGWHKHAHARLRRCCLCLVGVINWCAHVRCPFSAGTRYTPHQDTRHSQTNCAQPKGLRSSSNIPHAVANTAWELTSYCVRAPQTDATANYAWQVCTQLNSVFVYLVLQPQMEVGRGRLPHNPVCTYQLRSTPATGGVNTSGNPSSHTSSEQ